jgi:Cu(I)/Ag(I) efflux system membrane fusion protein
MALLKGEAHQRWMELAQVLHAEAEKIKTSDDLSEQRLAFARFNDALYRSLVLFGLHRGTVYYQYCPMANGDEGAYWFSTFKEIENPYFGESMLKCGETREILEF